MSLLITCGFARAAVKALTVKQQAVRDDHGQVVRVEPRQLTDLELSARGHDFQNLFSFNAQQKAAHPDLSSFSSLSEPAFNAACRTVLNIYNRHWPGGPTTREKWLARFSPEQWQELPSQDKMKHRMSGDCPACFTLDPSLHNAFPTKTRKSTLTNVWKEVEKTTGSVSKPPAQKESQECAQATAARCLFQLNKRFQEAFNTSFESALVADPKCSLQLTPTKNELRQQMRHAQRVSKDKREREFAETDFADFFGSYMSKSEYEKQRLNECLESKQSAQKRTAERLEGQRAPPRKVSLNYGAMQWDWKALVDEAKLWEKGRVVNWSAVARQYGIHEVKDTTKLSPKGGQIARAVLEDHAISTTHFFTGKGTQTGAPRTRRTLRRTGHGISVPQHMSVARLEQQAEEKYISSEVSRPIDIVPRDYEQVHIQDDGTVKIVHKTVCGQKINLHRLLEQLCTQHQDLLAMKNFNPTKLDPSAIQERLQVLGQVSEKQFLSGVHIKAHRCNKNQYNAKESDTFLKKNLHRSDCRVFAIHEKHIFPSVAMFSSLCIEKYAVGFQPHLSTENSRN